MDKLKKALDEIDSDLFWIKHHLNQVEMYFRWAKEQNEIALEELRKMEAENG